MISGSDVHLYNTTILSVLVTSTQLDISLYLS